MGEVFRVRVLRLSREVAIKMPSKDFVSDPDRWQRFEQDPRAQAILRKWYLIK
jgi:hypothetical protein